MKGEFGSGRPTGRAGTIELIGITDDADLEAVQETLKEMTDGNSHTIYTTTVNQDTTITLSPVGDVDAFAERINFGTVLDVTGRTVKVRFEE